MNVLDFQDRTAPIPLPSDAQLRRLAPNLNQVTSYAALLLLSDRATPFLAKQPIWRDRESLRLLRLVEKHLIPEVVRRLKAGAKNLEDDHCASATADKATSGGKCKRGPRIRSATAALLAAAVAVIAGFVAGFNAHAPSYRVNTAVAPSPEIRRAIPLKPEIRRAIPVEPEIRRAIPVQIRHPRGRY